MLDQILGGLKGNLSDVLSKNNISADKLDDLVSLTGDSIKEQAGEEMASGNISGMLDVFKRGETGGPIVSGIVSNLVSKVTSKLGLNEGTAASIAELIVPMAIKAISGKLSAQGGDESALTSLLGMDTDGLLGKAKGMLGGLFK
ncbi:MAG: hypothetical protein KDC12_12635 [Flavobacteriales bacterium]|nr:hypothetical protein [Flavobacteriales bacterium]